MDGLIVIDITSTESIEGAYLDAPFDQTNIPAMPWTIPSSIPTSIDRGQAIYWSYAWRAGEAETRKSLADGHGKTFPNAQEAIRGGERTLYHAGPGRRVVGARGPGSLPAARDTYIGLVRPLKLTGHPEGVACEPDFIAIGRHVERLLDVGEGFRPIGAAAWQSVRGRVVRTGSPADRTGREDQEWRHEDGLPRDSRSIHHSAHNPEVYSKGGSTSIRCCTLNENTSGYRG